MNSKKTYIAYAIHYGELPCGCTDTQYSHVYEGNGNTYRRFDSYKEAEVAARAKMQETGADNWNVI